jgi:ATP citrate (pro-S)-lyase
MLNIQNLRGIDHKILIIGSVQPTIVQSILDFDYLAGKKEPSVKGLLVAISGKRTERYFWGDKEILLPRFKSYDAIPKEVSDSLTLFLNMNSGRRVGQSTSEVFSKLPNITGGVIFAENVPEKQAIEIYELTKKSEKFVIGPASVGLLLPGILKLGPIGGLTADQFELTGILQKGECAVFSASGGMVGEILSVLSQSNHGFSFCLTFGGDRFPAVTPKEAFLAAESDPLTKYIVYYGELGGQDEYELVDLIKDKKITKKVFAYIGGSVSEMFDTPVQFGHAKAMAGKRKESAIEKRKALSEVGVTVGNSFEEFVKDIQSLPTTEKESFRIDKLIKRKKKMFVSTISNDVNEKTIVLSRDLLDRAKNDSFGHLVGSMFLGREIKSKEFSQLLDFIFKLLVDNGPYQSGVVNTMIAARAGRDLVSSLSAGLLTIGSRFGGATNTAAQNWFSGANSETDPRSFVESFVKKGEVIAGIGHLKFRVDLPDPRVAALSEFAEKLKIKKYTTFAKSVEQITTQKKGSLILNVDGAMGALLLDYLIEFEKLNNFEIEELFEIEFFNAFFVFPRTVGFISHYLDQKRLDEGLFRLTEDEVGYVGE